MYLGEQQIALMIRTQQFIRPKKTQVVQITITASFVFTYLVRIEYGALGKIPIAIFTKNTLKPRIYQAH